MALAAGVVLAGGLLFLALRDTSAPLVSSGAAPDDAGHARGAVADRPAAESLRAFEPAPAEALATEPCVAHAELGADADPFAQIAASPIDAVAVRQGLLASRDPAHLAAAALLAETPEDRVAIVTQALAAGRNDAAVVWTAVQTCDEGIAAVECPSEEWQNELLRVDGQNSEAWIHVAAQRLRRGQEAEALAALQRAATSAETREYWAETLEMLERGIAAAGDYSFTQRVSMAFAVASANQPDYPAHLAMCRAQSQQSPVWAEACLAYGRSTERQRGTETSHAFAREIQIAALEASGGDASEVRARHEQERRTRLEELSFEAEEMLLGNPALFGTYLAAFRERGESAANEVMRAETARLRAASDECAPL